MPPDNWGILTPSQTGRKYADPQEADEDTSITDVPKKKASSSAKAVGEIANKPWAQRAASKNDSRDKKNPLAQAKGKR